MSALVRIPLQGKHLSPNGDLVVKPIMSLLVQKRDRVFRPFRFVVDSGSGISHASLDWAIENGLSYPTTGFDYQVNTASGRVRQRRRSGWLTVRMSEFAGSI